MVDQRGSSICGVCKNGFKPNEESVFCDGKCAMWYHKTCAKVGKRKFIFLVNNKDSKWFCERCGNDDATATFNKGSATMGPEVCNAQITKQESSGKNVYSIGDVMQELGRMSCQLNEINQNNKVFADSILKIENSVAQVKLYNEVVKKEVRVLIERNEELEQYMRLNNVLIDGIPKLEKENVSDIVLKIGQKIGVDITVSDIDIAHRLPQWKAGKPPTIIVKFVRRTMKEEFMREKAKFRNTNSVYFVGAPAHNIYLNEHLTASNRRKFTEARKQRDDGKFKFVWIKNGHIYIREDEEKPDVLYNEEKSGK